jgi:hypothetical protein
MYAGNFAADGTFSFARTLSRGDLPGEFGNEEWYSIVASRPDLVSDVAYTPEISANLN